MGQKRLEDWQIKRINQLHHDLRLPQVTIAKRLDISRTAVRANLMPLEQWKERSKRLG